MEERALIGDLMHEVDRQFYAEHLEDWLPARVFDSHVHVWLKEFRIAEPQQTRGAKWPGRVAVENSIEDLLETYRLMLPRQQITPLIFGWPERCVDLDKTNQYAQEAAQAHKLPSLIVNPPEWSAQELERRVLAGGFLGLKPYLNFAPSHIPAEEITVWDFMPHAQLEVANQHGWIVLLHIARNDRLRDPLNLQHILEIERRYPRVRLIVAHIGRAYCESDVGNAFEVLGQTQRMVFDFSGNTNAEVIAQAIRAVGPRRVLFGSDLPIVRMRMRRICERGIYINLVPPGLYGDVSDDPHMREVSPTEGKSLTFFLYEVLWAFRRAADALGLSAADVEDVLYNNAARWLKA